MMANGSAHAEALQQLAASRQLLCARGRQR